MNVDSQNEKEKINALVEKSQRVLMNATTVFPFDFFPDSIIVDENKLTIVKRIFFWSETVFTVLVKDILSIGISSNPFFSTLSVEVKGFEKNPAPVNYLWNKDAVQIKKLITGLTTCVKEGINTSLISDKEVARKVEEIGALHSE